MDTFEITYTWVGTLELEAVDEDAALKEARRELGQHRRIWLSGLPTIAVRTFDDETWWGWTQ